MTAALIDIGCNLTSPRLMNDLQRVLRDARAAGVVSQILTGTDFESNEAALSLANAHNDLFATAGFHPHHAAAWQPHCRAGLQSFARAERCVAVGEMGLDYFRHLAPPAAQRTCFAEQLAIAVTVQKPVFLHEREAFADFRAILREFLPQLTGAVWHCFTGTRAEMEEMCQAGVYFGITGWLCDPVRGKDLRATVKHIPLQRLMIETDAPYLTPKTLQPVPRTNEPQYLPEVLRVLAHCRGDDPSELARATSDNARRFFQLPTATRAN